MIALPRRDPQKRSAGDRAVRAERLRLVLGLTAAWPQGWRDELLERVAIAEVDGCLDPVTAEREAVDTVRRALLGRVP